MTEEEIFKRMEELEVRMDVVGNGIKELALGSAIQYVKSKDLKKAKVFAIIARVPLSRVKQMVILES